MNLSNSKILITGGTGTFGQAFVNFVLKKYKPKKLIIFSRDELKQYEMSQIYNEKTYPNLRYFIGDIRDTDRLTFALNDVDYVVHAAAMKHVNIAEYNPTECISTNIDGARNLIKVCISSNVKRLISISTDKAVNPINLYGATKLASDKLFIAANNLSSNKNTIFSVVRYGNVVNSRGSVIPLFYNLLKNNSKFLPITDPQMTRFLIKIEDGVKFVISSLNIMKGGEIFIPKLPSTNIMEIANIMAPKLNKKIIGVRPGEKLHEFLCISDDAKYTLDFGSFYLIYPSIKFFKQKIDYKRLSKIIGKPVEKNFDYNSLNNDNFLRGKALAKFLQ